MADSILISAGEASGDLYAAHLVEALNERRANLTFFGCAGPRMQAAGVDPVVDSSSLAVAGIVEVARHIPRIYREYRKLLAAVRTRRPRLAILTDSPDFHLRLARQLAKLGIPVVYLVAPQVWAWRKDRLPVMRRTIRRLLCIFPFEEQFFRDHNMPVTYIGHPLTRLIRASASPAELRRRFGVEVGVPLIALLPGSRSGEVTRHLPDLVEAAERIRARRPAQFILALPKGFSSQSDLRTFRERFLRSSIQVQEGHTWDVLATADLALAASGTVTVEACLLRTPMITFYRVNRLSWIAGKLLVRVPFYSMVNLIAGRRVVPEIMQDELSGARLADEAERLLSDGGALASMRAELDEVRARLAGPEDPIRFAASQVEEFLSEERVHAL
ncbi:MAG: lipid-A-disaccharide synthase [Acidobacteriaceae bacterium]|nr:lipid-A-disaccharide synthase [Acidobacteriaceae bacterium]